MDTSPGAMPTIPEHAFRQLLSGAGKVRIAIKRFDRYFVPFVYHTPADCQDPVPCGVIVRQRDMFAATSPGELQCVLSEIAGPELRLDIAPDAALH